LIFNAAMLGVHPYYYDYHQVVVNDLAVAIFRTLENRIRESDDVIKSRGEQQQQQQQQQTAASAITASSARRSFQRIISGSSSDKDSNRDASSSGICSEEPIQSGTATTLSVDSIAHLVHPDSALTKDASAAPSSIPTTDTSNSKTPAASRATPTADFISSANHKRSSSAPSSANSAVKNNKPSMMATLPQLLTPMDETWDLSQLSAKDVEAIGKRDIGRREKLAADLSLLAGSPLDAYERYLKAASLCRTGTPDPLWYAMALEGCAAAHIGKRHLKKSSMDATLDSFADSLCYYPFLLLNFIFLLPLASFQPWPKRVDTMSTITWKTTFKCPKKLWPWPNARLLTTRDRLRPAAATSRLCLKLSLLCAKKH
jgi:Transport protein Trs120 or TRAPPC9, TRAPP II complex subunit